MIFLDNASTTKICKEALDVYNTASNELFYNPSALYKKGSDIHQAISRSKERILKYLGAGKYDNIIFTSGATESNNMAIRSFLKPSKKALFGITEHPSVYNVAKYFKDNGYNIDFVNVTSNGDIDLDDFKNKLDGSVNFVSIMHVNNETGAINPIKDLVQLSKKANKNIIFHCDGVQAFGKIDVDLEDLGVDLYTISSHKIYGPKGIGALYIKKGINIAPLMFGGGQENNLRSGTENTPAIFAFEKACEVIIDKCDRYKISINELNNYTKEQLQNLPFDIVINSKGNTSPYIISFSIANLRAETLLHMLEEKNILVGNGSACSSKKSGNRILDSMGVEAKYIEGSLRISFNLDTTKEDIDLFIHELEITIKEYKNNTNR